MAQYDPPFEQQVLLALKLLQSDVGVLKSDVSTLKSDVGVLKSDVGVLKSDMKDVKSRLTSLETKSESLEGKFDSLQETVFDMREEMRTEASATRALLNQAFDHISDQIASSDHQRVPSMIFRTRVKQPVSV